MKSKVVWLVLCLIWGSTWLFIKLGLENLPPFTFAGIRFVIAAAILFAIIKAKKFSLPRDRADWILLAVTGVLSFSMNYAAVFWGEQYISSGLAALLQAMIPAFGLLFAHLALAEERLTSAKIFGVLMGVFGVGVVFSNQLSIAGPRALAGSAAIVVGAASAAAANVLVKKRGAKLQPAILAGGQMIFGLVPLFIVGVSLEGSPFKLHWTPMAVVALFYLAIVGSVVAFLLYYWLVQHMDVTKTMLIALVTPVVAVMLGMVVLHEQLNWRTFAGGAMIISGIGLIALRRVRMPAPQ
ncbi:MAG TPA: EamA family transporter [Pyrinomonadaceae bacterium]|nr:EamA family transporter [Pyrinomonadaceae bacterium]